jgi:BirA family transcriptional regulator, biotin operon repressor / biotin---[acetyl-CoA-carboxylase] ligase
MMANRRIGHRVLRFESLASTNDTAAELGEPGLVVIANHQTAGRGQYGRVWQSEPGESLLMSIVVPTHEFAIAPRPVVLTAWAAIALGDAIFRLTGQQARIKWPNDLLIRGQKVCGILTESHRGIIVGIGLNLNQTVEEFATRELPSATSLALAAGRAIDVHQACEVVVAELDAEFTRLVHHEFVAMEADWKWRIGLLGRTITVEMMDGECHIGRLREMSFDAIELESGGEVRRIVPEFVRHLR